MTCDEKAAEILRDESFDSHADYWRLWSTRRATRNSVAIGVPARGADARRAGWPGERSTKIDEGFARAPDVKGGR